MSAGPDGRYVRCTARDWGGALLYWWGSMFPQYVGGFMKFVGMVFNSTSKIVGVPVAGAFGGVVPRGCYTTERRFFAHEASMDAYKSSGRRLHEQALSLQFQAYMQQQQQAVFGIEKAGELTPPASSLLAEKQSILRQ